MSADRPAAVDSERGQERIPRTGSRLVSAFVGVAQSIGLWPVLIVLAGAWALEMWASGRLRQAARRRAAVGGGARPARHRARAH
jgi:hypothetical protein